MAFDDRLAERVRHAIGSRRDVTERRMFGGLAFMAGGRMCCGVIGTDLMVRVGPDGYERALRRPHAREMDFTGKPLTGMVYVGPDGCRTARQVQDWVDEALAFASTLAAPGGSGGARRRSRTSRA